MLTSPSLVWLRALEWDHLESALQLKSEADCLAVSGDTESACARYSFLIRHWSAGANNRHNYKTLTKTQIVEQLVSVGHTWDSTFTCLVPCSISDPEGMLTGPWLTSGQLETVR